jgi:hypothetical protein
MAKKKKPFKKINVPKYQGGGNIFGFDFGIEDMIKTLGGINAFNDLMQGTQNEQYQRTPDMFNPMNGFHGFNYQQGGNVNYGQEIVQDWNNVPNLKIVSIVDSSGRLIPTALENQRGERIDYQSYVNNQIPQGFQYAKGSTGLNPNVQSLTARDTRVTPMLPLKGFNVEPMDLDGNDLNSGPKPKKTKIKIPKEKGINDGKESDSPGLNPPDLNLPGTLFPRLSSKLQEKNSNKDKKKEPPKKETPMWDKVRWAIMESMGIPLPDIAEETTKYQYGGYTNGKLEIAELERQKALGYISSEEYRQRLANFERDSASGDQVKALTQVGTAKTKVGDLNQNKELNYFRQGLTSTRINKTTRKPIAPSEVTLDDSLSASKKLNAPQVAAHEFAHVAREGVGFLPAEEKFISDRIKKSGDSYQDSHKEYHADMYSVRTVGKEYGITDTDFGNTTPERLKKAIEEYDASGKYNFKMEAAKELYEKTAGETPEEKYKKMTEVWNTVAKSTSEKEDEENVAATDSTTPPTAKYGGYINTTGYTPGTSTFNNPFNIIPSGKITMGKTPFPVMGKSLETGETKIMKPGKNYNFKNTKHVLEIPQFQMGGQPTEEMTMFNNSGESDFDLSSYLPFILDDARNTLNAGNRPLIEIQAEKGEYIMSPMGDVVKVAAKKKHKNMDKDEVSDVTAEGNYVLSNDKKMAIKKKSSKMEDIKLGYSQVYYKEGELNKVPVKYTMADVEPNKVKYTPAQMAKKIADKFPVTDMEKDPFAKRAQVENKLSRIPYLNILRNLSERKKGNANPQKFKFGGNPMARYNQIANDSLSGFYYPQDPMMKFMKRQDNSLPHMQFQYQGGGEINYDDAEAKKFWDMLKPGRKREQWNSWIGQTQDFYQDFFLNTAIPNRGLQTGIQALTTMGMTPSRGDAEYLYGNQYFSRLNNQEDKVARDMEAERSYYESGLDRTNSSLRLASDPTKLSSMRADEVRNMNQAIAGLGRERRSYSDKYGSARLNATDMFAGRQNQQKAYLNDFRNSQIASMGQIGSSHVGDITALRGQNLAAQSQMQMLKQPGNAMSDTLGTFSDIANMAMAVVQTLSGTGFLSGKQPQTQQPNGTYSGYNPFPNGAPGFDYSQYTQMPRSINGFNTALQVSTTPQYNPMYDDKWYDPSR